MTNGETAFSGEYNTEQASLASIIRIAVRRLESTDYSERSRLHIALRPSDYIAIVQRMAYEAGIDVSDDEALMQITEYLERTGSNEDIEISGLFAEAAPPVIDVGQLEKVRTPHDPDDEPSPYDSSPSFIDIAKKIVENRTEGDKS